MNENILLLQQQLQQYPLPQSNSQQQGQQGPTHSQAQLSYYLGHPGSGPSYSPGTFSLLSVSSFSMLNHGFLLL